MSQKQNQNNGMSAFLRKFAPFLFPKKRRVHTHYHYSHKRSQTAKLPAATLSVRKSTHRKAETYKEPEEVESVPAVSEVDEGRREKGEGMGMEEESEQLNASNVQTDVEEMDEGEKENLPSEPSSLLPSPSPQSAGKIIETVIPVQETKAEVARKTAEIVQEKGWMEKVLTKKIDHTLGHWSAWTLLKERLFSPVDMSSFFRRAKQEEAPVTKELTKEEIQNDSFLKRVQKKNISAPVGVEMDEEDLKKQLQAQDATSTLASFAAQKEGQSAPIATQPVQISRILPPLERKKDEPAPIRKEEPMPVVEQKKEEAPAKPEEAKPVPKIIIQKRASAFSAYIASLNYMGLGKERMMFIQNMATMLNAGLPLIDAIRTIQLETHNKSMKKLLQQILTSVENGSSFWRAMDDRHFFSLHAIALVRIGEESGSLAENMEYLAHQEEKDHELKGKVKMAMIYPSIVMTIMFILVIGLGWFVLPNLIGVLFSLGVPLPLVTRMVIGFTNFFTNYGVIAVPGMIIGMIGFVILNKVCMPVKIATQWVMFRIPGVGVLAREATIARFGVILGGLLKAGVPVIEAVQSLIEVTPVIAYRNLYTHMLEHISVGDSFSKSFQSIKGSDKLLPPSVQQLVVTGEKSGSLADIMLKVADIYDKKASETAQKLPVVLEPLILMFIGGLVGTIAFAIIVPIYSIVGNVGR